MIVTLDDLMELVNIYHKWVVRVLVLFAAVLLVYGGYRYGVSKGLDRAFAYVQNNLSEICTDDKAKSSYTPPNVHENQPGKMWSPEA